MAQWRPTALFVWCALAIWLSLTATPADLASHESPAPSDLVPIAVHDGVAEFDLPTTGRRDQFLLIVSSLCPQNGPFAMNVRAEPVSDPVPLRRHQPAVDPVWSEQIEQRRRELERSRRAMTAVPKTADRPRPPAEQTFWLMVRGDDFFDQKNYEAVRGRLVKLGEHCAVYLDAECSLDETKSKLAEDAATTFDRDVFPTAVKKLGRHRDIDGNGRFTLLFTPWLGRLAGGATSLGGFVRGSDFYDDGEPPIGNRCDMMYLNASLTPGPHLRTLIAHEYTHAITISEHVFTQYLPNKCGAEEESWLDEAIAHLAENLHGYSWSNLDYRISGFLNSPESYRLVVEDYYAADLWRGHGNRGATYLFLRWCVDQFGESLLRDLVQTNLCGIENVETSTGRPFAELYRAWSAAVFLSQSGLEARRDEVVRHVSLRGSLGGRVLAGPQHEYLNLSGDSRQFPVAGTSTKYFIAHSPAQPGTRVRVSASPDAALQVSIRALPDSLARLELKATRVESSVADDGLPCFQVQLVEHNGTPVTIERVAWERIMDGSNRETHRGAGFASLSANEVKDLFETNVVPAGGTINCPRLKLDAISPSDDRLVLKISGRDSAGNAAAAWCTIDLRPSSLAERPNAKQ